MLAGVLAPDRDEESRVSCLQECLPPTGMREAEGFCSCVRALGLGWQRQLLKLGAFRAGLQW
jgi:hypothetical protein